MADAPSPADDAGRPDPATAATPAEFVEALRRLKRWAGVGYRQLEKRAVAAGDALPRSTLTAALNRDTLPREDLVAAFARTCGCDDDETLRWVDARRRIAAGTGPDRAEPGRLPGADATETAVRGDLRTVEAGLVPPLIQHASWPVRALAASLAAVLAVTVLATMVNTVQELIGDPVPAPPPRPFVVVRTAHGDDQAWTNTAHTRVGVDDREADGNDVYAEYVTSDGTVRTVTDANGTAPGHSAVDAGGVVTRLRVCEQNEGCADWVQVS